MKVNKYADNDIVILYLYHTYIAEMKSITVIDPLLISATVENYSLKIVRD